MCGIAGIVAGVGDQVQRHQLELACKTLSKRGPDNEGIWLESNVGLAHTRLSIIDTSANSNQPFFDSSGRYVIIFNGEIFNFRELKNEVEQHGISLRTTGDTEILLYLYILHGRKCLDKLVGFFAFAIYDREKRTLFAARDRLGIKPFYYSDRDGRFCFGSEMKALVNLAGKPEIDNVALSAYFQLNYIPGPLSIYKNIKKLLPGHCLTFSDGKLQTEAFYTVQLNTKAYPSLTYAQQQEELRKLLDESVRLRLIADVPLGAFLSGGVDSSVIAGLASRHTKHLNTFSIGFRDDAFFDETEYANLVAKHFKTNHTVFKLTNDDLHESLQSMLSYIDEPFADSSALLVNLLSKFTRRHVTVALSGDGGDELFGGYNKHAAEWQIRNGGWKKEAVAALKPLWETLPKSRHTKLGNTVRQLERFAVGAKMDARERYWRWCSFIDEGEINDLLLNPALSEPAYSDMKNYYTGVITTSDLNEVLLSDIRLVLPNDMLTKVDLMSMANSLEVRVPFLDHRVVDFAFSIPASSKIDGKMKKKIVQDAFREMLPAELYNRPKRGFEVPLLQWMRTDLKSMIMDDLLEDRFIADQKIFSTPVIRQLKEQLFSSNPGDVHARIWAIVVFQYWYKNFHLRYV